MSERHTDRDGRTLKAGDLVHFDIDGYPYTGIIHALVRRDHEPAVLTLIQLMLPATAVSKELPPEPEAQAPSAPPTPLPTPKKGSR